MNEIKIRNMQLKDIDLVYALGSNEPEFKVVNKTKGFWTKDVLENWVNSNTDISLVAESQNKLTGFLLMTYNQTTFKAAWENLFVLSEYRSHGIAQSLYNKAELQLINLGTKSICSYPGVNNPSILKLHEKNKFSRGKQYYWMHKDLQ